MAPAHDRSSTRHVFSGDLERLLVEVRDLVRRRKQTLIEVADLDVPAIAVVVPSLDAFLDQSERHGGSILYLSPDHLGVMLEEQIDVVEEVRGTLPTSDDEEERAAAEAVDASLLRLLAVQNALGAPAFRFGYLRQGVLHEVLLEDDEAASGAALVDLTLRNEAHHFHHHDHDHDHDTSEGTFVPGR